MGPVLAQTGRGACGTSFVATGETGILNPAGVDLEISLVTSGGGAGKAGQTLTVARTFLGDASPNPFNPSTEITFGVAQAAMVQLVIYDAGGRTIRHLASGTLESGAYRRVWDGHDESGQPAAAGVYFVRLVVGPEIMHKKLVLVK